MIYSSHPLSDRRRRAWFALLAAGCARGLAAPQTSRTLEDGSVVELNPGAEISTHFTQTERQVTLIRGEAVFRIAKDTMKPFVVSAGGVQVRAVGTAFNVRNGTEEVQVTVLEGKVQVAIHADPVGGRAKDSLLDLNAGQRVVVPQRRSP